MPDFDALAAGYRADFERLSIRPEWRGRVDVAARRILSLRRRYETVAATTKVPWFVIALFHMRESDFDFSTHLHNGDSLKRRTVQVPAGRPKQPDPPYGWEESAIDALRWDRLDLVADWSVAGIAYAAETYNGFGPRKRGRKSGYLWAGSNVYDGGKFIADRKWNAAHWDTQLGVMTVLSHLMAIDEGIRTAVAAGVPSRRRPVSIGDALAADKGATATVVAVGSVAPAAPAATGASGETVWLIAGGTVLVVVLALGFVLRRRRQRIAAAAAAPIERRLPPGVSVEADDDEEESSR